MNTPNYAYCSKTNKKMKTVWNDQFPETSKSLIPLKGALKRVPTFFPSIGVSSKVN